MMAYLDGKSNVGALWYISIIGDTAAMTAASV
jgi:hypothetical protein